ncbi:AAA family ATPase [Labrenzia sp. DG1229]|uniref:AAA family ATPase n=1 Tax=Labrenzia sp. DG1229 TaxID=681847 RepID=UPI0007C81575|nr:AAA family ATPase [Labrenzia sp. DG1229]
MNHPFKIGVAGSHSTGKTAFVAKMWNAIEDTGLRVARINDLATRALELGFPILRNHTYESTLWIMAECMRQEAELSLSAEVVLVDRPVLDALGYLKAALSVSGRSIDHRRLDALERIAEVHSSDYDVMVVTSLDPTIPVGPGRDDDELFRLAAAEAVCDVIARNRPDALMLTSNNSDEIAQAVMEMLSAAGRLIAPESAQLSIDAAPSTNGS